MAWTVPLTLGGAPFAGGDEAEAPACTKRTLRQPSQRATSGLFSNPHFGHFTASIGPKTGARIKVRAGRKLAEVPADRATHGKSDEGARDHVGEPVEVLVEHAAGDHRG